MKTQKKNGQGLHLPTNNNRWKWMAGATAATAAAGVTASQASTITINLLNNYISADGGNHLNADLTGDGHPDLTLANAFASYSYVPSHGPFYHVGLSLNGVAAHGFWHPTDLVGTAALGSRFTYFFLPSVNYGHGTSRVLGSIPIFFKDLHINGGTPTKGSLEVTVFGVGPEIHLDSFSYNTDTPVPGARVALPDQGSSLALLAMGAGGILALRRWRAAQERS